jgi:acrylyl-CoA reductase (NADPH)
MSSSPSQFKALRVHGVDKRTESRFETLSIDDLTPGEVVIRVAWSCLNYKDALAVSGKGRIMRQLPRVAGIDCSGIVESSSDAAYKPGDKVLVTGCNMGELLDGGLAEYVRMPASAVVPLPAGLSLFEAMALGTAGFTAAIALRRMLENHQRPENGTIAITGPTGGVGAVAITLFKRAGFTVAAITGKKASAEAYLKQLGADEVISRQELTLGSKPLESVLWGGAVDNLGGDMLAWLTRTTRPWGNVGSVGLAASADLQATVMPFILRGVSLLGIHSVEMPREWRLDLWNKLAGEWKPKQLDGLIATRTIELDEVPAVCATMIAAETRGRTVVKLAGG